MALTQGIWLIDTEGSGDKSIYTLHDGNINYIGKIASEPDARRVAACVNACEGMPVEHIEQLAVIGNGVMRLTVKADDYRRERDELLAALEQPLTDDELETIYGNDHEDGWCGHDVSANALQAVFLRVLSARVAKAKGGVA
jgi:hypothetical protein